MIIIGVDQGIANFGFAAIKINDAIEPSEIIIEILESGTIKTSSKKDLGERLLKIRNKMEELIEMHNPQMIGCERLFYNAPTGGRNKSLGMMHVNMATGMLHILTFEKNILLGEYPPTTVKKAITGNGRASKEDVNKGIERYLTKKTKTEHEADAIAIGITTYYKHKEVLN